MSKRAHSSTNHGVCTSTSKDTPNTPVSPIMSDSSSNDQCHGVQEATTPEVPLLREGILVRYGRSARTNGHCQSSPFPRWFKLFIELSRLAEYLRAKEKHQSTPSTQKRAGCKKQSQNSVGAGTGADDSPWWQVTTGHDSPWRQFTFGYISVCRLQRSSADHTLRKSCPAGATPTPGSDCKKTKGRWRKINDNILDAA